MLPSTYIKSASRTTIPHPTPHPTPHPRQECLLCSTELYHFDISNICFQCLNFWSYVSRFFKKNPTNCMQKHVQLYTGIWLEHPHKMKTLHVMIWLNRGHWEQLSQVFKSLRNRIPAHVQLWFELITWVIGTLHQSDGHTVNRRNQCCSHCPSVCRSFYVHMIEDC